MDSKYAMSFFLFFFFSSRRLHTRYWRDWSSDLFSSDLLYEIGAVTGAHPTCPQQDDQTFLALSRTTGYQVRIAGQRGPYRVPRDGKIVAWTVKLGDRSEESRVGKECRSRRSPYH